MKIGIPKSLLFYNYYPLWKTFFESLGTEVITSSSTTKTILQEGLKLTVDEACLPIKVAFGHVASLRDKVDLIFVPRLVSVSPKEYICPKFLGLPDMVRHGVPGLPGIIDSNINQYRRERDMYRQFYEIGLHICRNPVKIATAYKKAVVEQKRFVSLLESGMLPEQAFRQHGDISKKYPSRSLPIVAVLGHPYNIYDSFINMNLFKRLQESGVHVVTPENVPETIVNKYAGTLSKRLFWTLGRRMVGSAFHFMDNPAISGIIHVASFACGPDSMTGELIERRIRRNVNIPFLNLTLDEHSSEAGIVTRMEAFLDMINMRQIVADRSC